MLPVDILDIIFSFLDLPSLEAVSSTNSFFSSIAERHRYADIALTANVNDSDLKMAKFTPTTLLGLLEKRPHIGNYILYLSIRTSARYDKIVATLDLLQNLKKITIEQEAFVDLFSSQPSDNFRFSLENSLRLPSMQELNVRPIVDVPLPSCLRDMADFDGKLQHLSIGDLPHSCIKQFMPWITKFSKNLQYFRASLNDNEFCTVVPILSSCSNTLTVLRFHLTYRRLLPGYSPPGYETLDLPHLKEASFYVDINTDEHGPVTTIPFSVIAQLLQTTPDLQRLCLCFNPYSIWGFFCLDQLETDWGEVDSFLETRGRSAGGFIVVLFITTENRWPSWTPYHDTKITLAKYPNIRRMMEENTFVISNSLSPTI